MQFNLNLLSVNCVVPWYVYNTKTVVYIKTFLLWKQITKTNKETDKRKKSSNRLKSHPLLFAVGGRCLVEIWRRMTSPCWPNAFTCSLFLVKMPMHSWQLQLHTSGFALVNIQLQKYLDYFALSLVKVTFISKGWFKNA